VDTYYPVNLQYSYCREELADNVKGRKPDVFGLVLRQQKTMVEKAVMTS